MKPIDYWGMSKMKKPHNQTGGMIYETDTSHSGCEGVIHFDPSLIRLRLSQGEHRYRCDKCYKTWIFKRKCNETNN